MAENEATGKKKSMLGYLMASARARGVKNLIAPAAKPKKDAWYSHPGYHRYQSEGGICIHCRLPESVHRREDECFEEYLLRKEGA